MSAHGVFEVFVLLVRVAFFAGLGVLAALLQRAASARGHHTVVGQLRAQLRHLSVCQQHRGSATASKAKPGGLGERSLVRLELVDLVVDVLQVLNEYAQC